MSHWGFVLAAYSVAVLAVAGLLLWAHASMRRAESAADKLQRK